MKQLYSIILFSLITASIHAQMGCGFDQYNKSLKIKYGEESLINEIQKFKNFVKSPQGQTLKGNYNTINIPVVFHVVHNGEFLGQESNISDEIIKEQLAILNNDFSKLTIPKVGFGVPTNPKFQFCLAKTDPFGQTSTGITRQYGNDYYVYNSETGPTDDDLFIKTKRWNPNIYLNVYITDIRLENTDTNPVDLESLEYGIGGYSSLPEIGSAFNGFNSDYEGALDGIVLNYRYVGLEPNYVGSTRVQVLTHEVGHWLGLFHVFNKQECYLAELGGNPPDCEVYGDGICDTPIMKSYSTDNFDEDFNTIVEVVGYENGLINRVKDCLGNTISAENFMDYGEIMTFFTEKQVEIMHQKTAYYRPDIYKMTRLNSDCTIDHGISLGGSGGGSGGTYLCPEEPVRSIFNSFLDNNDYNNFPFESDGFGAAVDMNANWLVASDIENGWLQIFKRTECESISYQNFHQSTAGFGKEIILNDNEIIVSADSKVYIYHFDGENWFQKQQIAPNEAFEGIYKKNNFLFVLGPTDYTIYKKNAAGNYIYHQKISHNHLPIKSSGIANFPGNNLISNRLILVGRNNLITVLGLNSNNVWNIESTQKHSELPKAAEYGLSNSITTTESNIFIMYRHDTGNYNYRNTLYIHPITTYNLGFNSNINNPFTSSDIQGLYNDEYASFQQTSKFTNKILALNDNLIIHSYGITNTGADIIERSGNVWIQKKLTEYCDLPIVQFKEANDFKIFKNELLFGGDGIVEVRNLKDYIDFFSFNNYNQISKVPISEKIYSEKITIGGQSNVVFENVSKEIFASDYIKLLPGTQINNGSNVTMKVTPEKICLNLPNDLDLYSFKVKVSSLNDFNKTDKEINDLKLNILLYPNPTKGILNVNTTTNYVVESYTIFSLNGVKLLQKTNSNRLTSFELNISSFPSGVFILNFVMENGEVMSKKIIKE